MDCLIWFPTSAVLSGFAKAFYFTIRMLTSCVATLGDLLVCTPVASRSLSATGDPEGPFSVDAGGGGECHLYLRPQLRLPFLVGVLVFRAGDDCCRGLIGLFHVVSDTLG